MKGLLVGSLLLAGWLLSGTPCARAAVVLPLPVAPAAAPEALDLRFAPMRAEPVSARVLERIAAITGAADRVSVPLSVEQPGTSDAAGIFDAAVTVPALLDGEAAPSVAPAEAAPVRLSIEPIPEAATGILGLAGLALAGLVPIAVLLFTQGSANRHAGSPARGGR